MSIRCVIVDDEPIARDLLINFIAHVPEIEIIGICENALEARLLLAQKQVDLLFLDIHMPLLDGLQFLSLLKNTPKVIFTTAYQEYAAKAFELEAIDYLVKPFSLDRFLKATDKVLEQYLKTTPDRSTVSRRHTILIKEGSRIHNLDLEQILFAEAKGNYTQVVTMTGTILTNISLLSLESKLPSTMFCRIHRSFIVNKGRVNHIEGNLVYINKRNLPLGSHFKNDFLDQLQK